MRKLSNIQVLRGIAALLVVVFHARDEVDALGIPTRLPSFFAGAFGVDLFFVISGLVMVVSSAPLFGRARSAPTFAGKRLARIVPLYWATTALFALLDPADARGALGRRAFAGFLALSLLFVPYAAPANEDSFPVYPLGWTLDYEMAFYACFAMVLVLPRRAAIGALAGGFATLVALGRLVALPGGLSYLASSQLLEFVAGLALAELSLAGRRLPAAAAAALVLAAAAAVLATTPTSDAWWGAWRGVVWGLPAAAAVGALALWRPRGAAGPLRRGLERLGDASYALYLAHYGVYLAAEAALRRAVDPARLPAGPTVAGLVALAVLAGFAVHHGFEVPVTRRLQRRVAPGEPPSLAVSGR